MANEIQIPANLVPKVWAAKVWTEGVKASYFDKFTDANGNNVIHKNVKLKGVKGDKVYFGLAMNLTGDARRTRRRITHLRFRCSCRTRS